jgi:glycosyltransferase involved in cell wall biosynthesis
MNVLQVIPGYYPASIYGGPVFSMHYACQALARRGVGVYVTTTNLIGTTGRVLDVPTDTNVSFEPNYAVRYHKGLGIGHLSWPFTRSLWRDMAAADIVHLQDVYSTHAVHTLMLAASLRRPVVISPRGIFSSWALSSRRALIKKIWLHGLIRPFIGDPRRVVWHATSASERDDILATLPKARVIVIANGIDCDRFDRAETPDRAAYLARFLPESSVQLPPGTKVVCAMGRLHPVKGFDIAIEAFALLQARWPDSVLLIAGGDEGERERLLGLIKTRGLTDRVALVGETRGGDTITFLKGGDLFLFPSHSENFGLACVEALAAGLPVVASNRTPWAEVEDAGAGRWADLTPQAFADAASELLSRDPGTLRHNARAVAARYGLDQVARDLQSAYQELINDNAA